MMTKLGLVLLMTALTFEVGGCGDDDAGAEPIDGGVDAGGGHLHDAGDVLDGGEHQDAAISIDAGPCGHVACGPCESTLQIRFTGIALESIHSWSARVRGEGVECTVKNTFDGCFGKLLVGNYDAVISVNGVERANLAFSIDAPDPSEAHACCRCPASVALDVELPENACIDGGVEDADDKDAGLGGCWET